MKRIGVLGGISAQATMDFEARVHRVSQRLIPQHWNRGYPPMVVRYHRRPLGCTEIPLLLEADGPQPDLVNPLALLAEAAVRLAIADAP